jgi:16S rRNA A1518/A1519 N6-dimethyltransferase RsmA/KsgA/DIM1 with predicted DNA glycosylase/AP lyase activity
MDAVFNSTGIDLGRRAETLSVEEFGKLADFLRT